MKPSEIVNLTQAELISRNIQLREDAFHLRIRQQSGQIDDPCRFRSIRREIAQIQTRVSKLKATKSA